MLRDLQRKFHDAVLGGDDAEIAPFVRAAGRLSIHRNTVQAGLTDVLATAFPVVRRIMGASNFTRAARRFIAAHPPRRPHLSGYGADLPGFLADFAPLKPLPYIPDVARLEWARSDAYFAADAAPLDPARLAAVAPAVLPNTVFTPHPATRLVASAFPVHTIWTVNQPEVADVPAVDMGVPETVLVTRPGLAVTARKLDPGDAAFTQALLSGATLGAAAEHAARTDGHFDLQAALGNHLTGGTFAAVA